MKTSYRKFMKWAEKYDKIVRLGKIRGKTWAMKHKKFYLILKAKIARFVQVNPWITN